MIARRANGQTSHPAAITCHAHRGGRFSRRSPPRTAGRRTLSLRPRSRWSPRGGKRTMNGVIELGVALLVVGAVVAVAEVHYPSHGVVGGVGVVAMAIGAVLAISGLGAGVLIGLSAGIALAGAGIGVLAVSVKQGAVVARRRVRTGAEGIVGHIGV